MSSRQTVLGILLALGFGLFAVPPAWGQTSPEPSPTPSSPPGEEGATYRGTDPRRNLRAYNPDPLAVVEEPERLEGTRRRAIRVVPGAIELVRGASTIERIPFDTSSPIRFEDVARGVGDDAWVEETARGEFLLRSAFVQAPGTELVAEAPGTRTIKLARLPHVFLGGSGARAVLSGILVTSWDEKTGSPVTDHEAHRPFIVYGGRSTLDVVDSEIARLGYDRVMAYGLSWYTGATGSVVNSDVHHSFFGVYSYEAVDLLVRGNRLRDNAFYGADPHSGSKGLVIERNDVFRNGKHGIIISQHVVDSVIRDNRSHHNVANGIMVDFESDGNLVSGNRTDHNQGDGIVVQGSSDVVVRGNQVEANRVGIRLTGTSRTNRVIENRISGNERGVEVYGGPQDTRFVENQVTDSSSAAFLVEAAGVSLSGDRVTGGETGVEVRGVVHVRGIHVDGVTTGIVVDARGIAEVAGAEIAAEEVGLDLEPGSLVRLVGSSVEAAEPLRGAEPRFQLDTSYSVPASALPWLAFAGVGFIAMAFLLQIVHRVRNRPARRRVRGALAGVDLRPVGWQRRRRSRWAIAGALTLVLVLLVGLVGLWATTQEDTEEEALRAEVAVRDRHPRGALELTSGNLSLEELDEALAAQGHDAALRRTRGAWLLARTLVVGPGAAVAVQDEELRLLSGPSKTVGLEARGGDLLIEESTVTSWDPGPAAPDEDPSDGRAWILARDRSRLDVLDSTVQMLGYNESERYGVSWRKQGTGEIDDSTFTGNYYGAYMHEADPMRITGSIFERSVLYGLDPHTRSRGFHIEENVFRDNGKHGLILANGCSDAVVAGNVAHGNEGHGIVVFERSDDVSVFDNEAWHNGGAGIDVDASARTKVSHNVVYENETGISLHDGATGTELESNRIAGNREDGVRIASGARLGRAVGNLVYLNYRAGIYVDDESAVIGPDNQLLENEAGVRVAEGVGAISVTGNLIADNVLDGVYLTSSRGVEVIDNRIVGNEKAAFSALTEEAAGAYVSENTLEENGAEIRVRQGE